MKKGQIILIGVGIVAVLALFSLPKVIVDSEKEDQLLASQTSDEANSKAHSMELKDDSVIINLKSSLNSVELLEKKLIFADSLAKLYFLRFNYDSGKKYNELMTALVNADSIFEKQADNYYSAYLSATDMQYASKLGGDVRETYTKLSPDNNLSNDQKAKFAMTYASTSNPMQAIMQLREVLEADSLNKVAILNMGILSIRSGQIDKALTRLKKLSKIDADNPNVWYYLGIAYQENDQKQMARMSYQKALNLSESNSILKEGIEQILKNI